MPADVINSMIEQLEIVESSVHESDDYSNCKATIIVDGVEHSVYVSVQKE